MSDLRRWILLSLGLGAFACRPSVDLKEETNRLLETDRAFSQQSAAQGSAAAFRAYLEPGAVELPDQAEPIAGRDMICREMEGYRPGTKLVWEPKAAEVAAGGDFGYSWGTYIVSFRNQNDSLVVHYGKYLSVWRKQKDGGWRVVVDMGNRTPPPAGSRGEAG